MDTISEPARLTCKQIWIWIACLVGLRFMLVIAINQRHSAAALSDQIAASVLSTLFGIPFLLGVCWVVGWCLTKVIEQRSPRAKGVLIASTAVLLLACFGEDVRLSSTTSAHAGVAEIVNTTQDASEAAQQSTSAASAAAVGSSREQEWQQTLAFWKHDNAPFLADPARAAALQQAIDGLEKETGGKLSAGRLIALAQDRAFRATNWDVANPDDWNAQWKQMFFMWSQRHSSFLSDQHRVDVINEVINRLWPQHTQVRPEVFLSAVEDESFRLTKWQQYSDPAASAGDGFGPKTKAEEEQNRRAARALLDRTPQL